MTDMGWNTWQLCNNIEATIIMIILTELLNINQATAVSTVNCVHPMSLVRNDCL